MKHSKISFVCKFLNFNDFYWGCGIMTKEDNKEEKLKEF